jgi:N-acetylmuramoyl-L-alanine amidase
MLIFESLICLSLAIFHEARGEPALGQIAIAWVIENRKQDPRYPGTVCQVVEEGGTRLNGCQFSYYCDGVPEWPVDDKRAYGMAFLNAVLYRMVADPTLGSTNYHASSVSPSWGSTPTITINNHLFYKL